MLGVHVPLFGQGLPRMVHDRMLQLVVIEIFKTHLVDCNLMCLQYMTQLQI